MNRNLDGCYFRINGQNVCFSDLTPEERESVLDTMAPEGWRRLCCILADSLRSIGDQLNLRIE